MRGSVQFAFAYAELLACLLALLPLLGAERLQPLVGRRRALAAARVVAAAVFNIENVKHQLTTQKSSDWIIIVFHPVSLHAILLPPIPLAVTTNATAMTTEKINCL